MEDIKIFAEPLDVQYCVNFVSTGEAGAIDVFLGTVRNHTKGKKVLRLEYEAYEPMAISEMKKIAAIAFSKFPVHKIAIHHRIGVLNIEEPAVIIAVSTPHRKASFEACQFIIDTLKQTVPIWKKELFDDGEVWVAAHP